MNNRVLVGLSGGVDSTATALFLKKSGYDVYGFFFDVLGNQQELRERAKAVATKLDIPFLSKDISNFFKEKVMDYFCDEYLQGRTPNPCVKCNKFIKFKLMLEEAFKVEAHYIATGHYAKVEFDENLQKYIIRKADNLKKDQTYMLYQLNQETLQHVLFPLGKMESKEKIRQILIDEGFNNAETKDSQEICFIKDNDYVTFIKNTYKNVPKEGTFVDQNGNKVGTHKGILNYTIGQRKGLGVTFGRPTFVTAIDAMSNTVTLGDNIDLFKDTIYSKDNNFIHINPNEPLKVTAKIRYSAKPEEAVVFLEQNGIIKTVFKEPQRASTPGQSIVFYQDDILIGGGTII